MARFEEPCHYLRLGTWENHEYLPDRLCQGRDLNSGPPEYKTVRVTTWYSYLLCGGELFFCGWARFTARLDAVEK